MTEEQSFTFVCLAAKQVATAIDIQVLPQGAQRQHAWNLLREHLSADSVEIWQGEVLVDTIDRDGAWPRPAASETAAPSDLGR
jgi:hypothetical protein